MRKPLVAASVVLSLFAFEIGRAAAHEIVLKSRDGKSWVTGRIVAIGDQHITLATRFGEMSIIRDAVYCEGTDCPELVTAEGIAAGIAEAVPGNTISGAVQAEAFSAVAGVEKVAKFGASARAD